MENIVIAEEQQEQPNFDDFEAALGDEPVVEADPIEEAVEEPVESTPTDIYADLSAVQEPVSNALSDWQVKHTEDIENLRKQESENHEAKLAEAKEQLDQFYAERQSRIEKRAKANREAEVATMSSQTTGDASRTWEQVVDLVHLPGRESGRDVSRQRQVILQMKEGEVKGSN